MLQDENLCPRRYCGQVQVLVLLEAVEKVQEDHGRDCQRRGDQGEETSADQELWHLAQIRFQVSLK